VDATAATVAMAVEPVRVEQVVEGTAGVASVVAPPVPVAAKRVGGKAMVEEAELVAASVAAKAAATLVKVEEGMEMAEGARVTVAMVPKTVEVARAPVVTVTLKVVAVVAVVVATEMVAREVVERAVVCRVAGARAAASPGAPRARRAIRPTQRRPQKLRQRLRRPNLLELRGRLRRVWAQWILLAIPDSAHSAWRQDHYES